MNQTSFLKGEQFEKFVLANIFPATHYDLVHQTNSSEQNQYRFVENSLKPDFKFRCKRTRCEFYVEAKYRSDFNRLDQKIEIMRPDQFERYKDIQQTEGVPVFVVVGYQGRAVNPLHISFIRLDELQYLGAYASFLQRFEIPKTNVDSYNLNLATDTAKNALIQPKMIKKSVRPIAPIQKRSKARPVAYALGIIGLLCFIFLGMHAYQKAHVEESLRKKTEEYYQTLDMGNIAELDRYVNPTVDKWYYKTNLTLDDVKREARYYFKKYSHTQTAINWNTFNVIPLNDDYLVTYQMDYRIFSNRLKKKVYHLKIKAVWDKNLKIKSMYEIKI